MPSGPPQQRHPSDAQQVVEGKFDADAEHEKDHTDLCKQVERMDIGNIGSWGERADQCDANHINQYQRLTEEVGHAAPEDSGDEYVGEISKEHWIRGHVPLSAVKILLIRYSPSRYQ